VVTVPAFALKDAEVEPAATETLVGSVNSFVLLLSDTVTLEVELRDKPTEQLPEPPELKLAGLQVNEETCTGVAGDTVRLKLFVVPRADAETVAVCELVT
jgi:hypothetical protein